MCWEVLTDGSWHWKTSLEPGMKNPNPMPEASVNIDRACNSALLGSHSTDLRKCTPDKLIIWCTTQWMINVLTWIVARSQSFLAIFEYTANKLGFSSGNTLSTQFTWLEMHWSSLKVHFFPATANVLISQISSLWASISMVTVIAFGSMSRPMMWSVGPNSCFSLLCGILSSSHRFRRWVCLALYPSNVMC